jgi:hypothetical protein
MSRTHKSPAGGPQGVPQAGGPARWLDGDELPSGLRSELSAYGAEVPNVERRARMLASLEQQLGFAEVPTAQPAGGVAQPALGGGTGAGVSAAAGTLFKLVLGALAAVGVSIGVWSMWAPAQPAREAAALLAPHDARSSLAAFRPVDPQLVRLAAAVESEPALAPTGDPFARQQTDHVHTTALPTRAAVVHRERKTKPVAPSREELDLLIQDDRAASGLTTPAVGPLSELTLLARARRSLLTSPERSLELAEQHAREFPAGTLCEEREVLAIESLLKLGLVMRAKERTLAFERTFPSSAHRAHLARLIALPAR